MAARHFFPLLSEVDIGPDTSKVLPLFPDLELVRYRAGMPAEQLITQMRGKPRVALDAPPGAKKSVDMPAKLMRGGFGRVIVHCMPSRTLSVSLHDYVKSLNPDLQTTVVTDYAGPHTFPEEGLVFVSSSILVAYMSAWRAHGVTAEIVLYLDEVHESDFATASLRRLKNAAPGVKVYIEATATRGAGRGGNFPVPTLPSAVTDYNFQRVSAAKWDMRKQGAPWSLLKIHGDFLIFEDDPSEAKIICEKFQINGIRAYRLTAKTDVDDFRRTMAEINNPDEGLGAAALVVDYSYRSGFTFPTVARIIDPGEVRYLAIEHGRPVYCKRSAYRAELYQARNRGGRVEDRPCDYWCGEGAPQAASVLLEGVEGDLACMAQRMLGFKPDQMLTVSPYYEGKVPRQFEHIMCGEQPLRSYAAKHDWPGEDHAPKAPEPVSPMEADFPMTPRSMSCEDEDRQSVFTMDDDDVRSSGSLSEEAFAAARDKSRASRVRARPMPRLEDPPPMPALDGSSAKLFDEAFGKLASGGVGNGRVSTLEFGPYYYAAGLPERGLSYADFAQVLCDCRDMSPQVFLRGFEHRILKEIAAHALLAYNDSIVIATAAQFVVSYAASSEVVKGQVDPAELRHWASEVRGDFVRANGHAKAALEFMNAIKGVKFLKAQRMADRESQAAENFLNGLACRMHDENVQETYQQSLPPVGFDPSGRYYLDVQPDGWRAKLALAVLGRKPGMIDLAVSPADSGGTVSVHSTASELALANGRR